MPWLRPTLWLVALVFSALSFWVLLQIGYLGIWRGGFANLGSLQIAGDLVIACMIGIGFIARDCRAKHRAWWPWALLTLIAGSIGLLAYLLWPKR
jgi:cytochrome bd-type quinol oxidase subunit 2